MPGTRGPVPVPVQGGGSDLTQEILDTLDANEPFITKDLFPNVHQTDIKAALDRLSSRSMIKYDTLDAEQVLLTAEGEIICNEGSHEFKVWDAVRKSGKLELKDLQKTVGNSANVGQGNAMKNKWIKKDGTFLVPVATHVEDATRKSLEHVQATKNVPDPKQLTDYKKRKLVTVAKIFSYRVRKGPKYSKHMPIEVTDLTVEMLENDSWKTASFKPYNFESQGALYASGALHPLNKVKSEFRDIFYGMGFTEMPTDRYVESGFWNFDALFVPQQHPARDLQDTFYVSDPPKADKPRADPIHEETMNKMEGDMDEIHGTKTEREPRDYEVYWNNIRRVHQEGGFGSIGYRYPWSEDECLRLVLRTHTTAVSTWALHRLAADPRPAKYYSIDRVFRNESVDATHLAEFHQIEGVFAEYDLTLGNLMGFLEKFFRKLGVHNLRFKPAYNPYTEPSMEVFGYHEGLKKWIEIGNSGLFRPEMLEPMGLPKNLRAFGFGLSLERPTMIKYGISNIRDLVGHKTNLNFIEDNPAVRLDEN